MSKVQILVGSVMGTARSVADALVTHLDRAGSRAVANASPSRADVLRDEQEVLLLCTSNTGMGDLPANIAPLYDQLTACAEDDSASLSLATRRYGVVILGDSLYPRFAEAGHKLDRVFSRLGATRLGEPLILDARYDQNPITTAKRWATDWITLL